MSKLIWDIHSTIYIPQLLGRLVLHHAMKYYRLPYHISKTTALKGSDNSKKVIASLILRTKFI